MSHSKSWREKMSTDNNDLVVLDEGKDETEEVPTCCSGGLGRA